VVLLSVLPGFSSARAGMLHKSRLAKTAHTAISFRGFIALSINDALSAAPVRQSVHQNLIPPVPGKKI
jgi:hypothetical protein